MGTIAQKQRRLDQEIRKLRKDIEQMAALHDVDFDKVFMSRFATARTIGVTPRTLDRWCKLGYIRRIVIGGRVYYSKREILRIAKLYNYGIGELADSFEFSPFQPFSKALDEHLKVSVTQ